MGTTRTLQCGSSAEAVQAHYDVGNDFYRLWLDPTLSYSCALWLDDPADTLEAAQRRKIRYHVRQARATGAARVLDIGCGWGALLRHLVEAEGVAHATGLTLSRRQAEWVAARRDPRALVRLEDWADHKPPAPYDAIISVGAFEHFARPEMEEEDREVVYREFFRQCHGWLRPGGWMSLQTIAYGRLDRHQARASTGHSFLLGEVFPEAELPTLPNVLRAVGGLFEPAAVRDDGPHYARTCLEWFARLSAQRAEAAALACEETVRRYLRYLKFSAALFHGGHIGLLRLTLRRLDG
jgi:cyclopropane-fatty-acyl-phospholipid synthase